MNIRAIMQAKYPKAYFGEYFCFLVSCAGTLKGLTHEHHIAPRKQFQELVDAPENRITLTISDHATAHRLLGAAVPEMWCGDRWIASQSNPEFIAECREWQSKRLKKQHTDPVFAAGQSERCRRLVKKQNADPVFVAKRNAAASATSKMLNANGVLVAAKSERCKTFPHIRWHSNRGIVNLKCELCRKGG